MPKVYQAAATLFLLPTKPSAERLATLTPETYQSLIESDFVKAQVQQAVPQGLSARGGIAKNLRAELVVKGNQPYKLIDLIAQADTPEKAALLANTWAEISIRESLNLFEREKKSAFKLVEQQQDRTAKNLNAARKELGEKQEAYAGRLLKTQTGWEYKLLDLYKEMERLKNEYQKETERLRLDFVNKHQSDLMKQRLNAKENKLAELEDELVDLVIATKTKKDVLAQIKSEPPPQPKSLALSEAGAEGAPVETAPESSRALPEAVDRPKTRNAPLSPVYQAFIERLADAEIEHNTLARKQEHIRKELDQVRSEIEALRTSIKDRELELFALLKNRELGLDTLEKEQSTRLNVLQAARERDMSALARQRSFEVGDLEKRYDATQRDLIALTQRYDNARMAKDEEEIGVKMGMLAVAPEAPIKPRILFNTAVAFMIGLMTSVVVAFLAEYAKERRAKSEERGARSAKR
jgi:capsular polysaccharide biosynthesis protein